MTDHVGLVPVPSDGELVPFLQKMIDDDTASLDLHTAEVEDTIDDTVENQGQPIEFAYAKMLNFLANDEMMSRLELVHLCAAALWKLHEDDNQPIVELHVLETDKK